jgi:SAM-dependent methyltransferase
MLEKTRKIWKRRAQAKLFDVAGIGDYLEDREMMALEEHMGFHGQIPEHRRFQITELKRLGLKPSQSVLEIGCGPLTAGIPVIQYLEPNRYVGVDVRPAVLDAAWQQIGKHELSAKNPRLLCSDDFGDEALGEETFNYIWSFSVLFHLADGILDRLFASAARRLSDGGVLVANVQTDTESSTWLQFPFLKRSIEDYAVAAAAHGLAMENLGTIAQRGFRLEGAERNNPLLRFSRR